MRSNMRYLDITGDYYLRKGMELEKERDRLLEQYAKSQNPRTLETIKRITEECNALWRTVKLREYSRLGMEQYNKSLLT